MVELVVNDAQTRRQMLAMTPALKKATARAVKLSIMDVEREAKRMVQRSPATGDIVQLRNPNRIHQRSAPGEPPATSTGRLASSIIHQFDKDRLGGSVVARAKYAAFLELGTVHMKARPFLFPALISMKSQIRKHFKRATTAGIRKASKK